MGAFAVLRPGAPSASQSAIAERLAPAGMGLAQTRSGPFGTLLLFDLAQGNAATFYEAPNGNFAFAVGTYIDQDQTGVQALRQLLERFDP